MSADVAIGLTLDDSDYNSVAERADKRLERLGRHDYSRSRAGARALGREIQDVGKHADNTIAKLSRLERFTQKAERVSSGAQKLKWAAFATAGLAEAGAIFSKWRMKQIQQREKFQAEDAAALLKWQKRRDRLSTVAGKAGSIGLISAGVQYGAGGLGFMGRLFGGGAKRGMDETRGAAESLAQSLTSATGQGSTFAGVLEGIGGVAGKVVIGLTGLGVAGAAGVGMLLKSGVGLNANLEEATAQFEIFTGSADKAKAMVAALKREADVSPFSTMEVIGAGASLISMADKNQQKLMDLVKTAERLTVLNPNKNAGGGLESASIALKNALSGNYQSLAERFNVAPSQLEAIKAQGKSGLDLIKGLLVALNIGEGAVQKMSRTWRGLLSTVLSFVDTLKQSFAQPFFEWIKTKAEAATVWITKNGEWAINVARGLGVWLQDKIEALKPIGNSVRSWFNVVMNWVDILPEKLAAAWQGNKFSAFFAELGGKLFDLAKEIAAMLFDTFVAASEIMGLKIWDALPELLGGGGGVARRQKMRETGGAAGAMVADAEEAVFRQFAQNRFKQAFTDRKANVANAAAGVGSTVSNFFGNTLGGSQAVAAAAAGKMGILDRASASGAMPTPGELQAKVEAVKQNQSKLASFASARNSIFAAAAERARRAGAAPGSAAEAIFTRQAFSQLEELKQKQFGAQADPTAPAAAGNAKQAKKAEANNAAAQMRPRNMNIGIAVTSLDGNMHGAYATAS